MTGRRSFIAATALGSARILGANDRIRLAILGMGGRGNYLMDQFAAQGAEIAAVCDVYEPRLDKAVQRAGPAAKSYIDYRRLLEDKTIDAVVIATPDHQHAQMFIDAVGAGKDVYVEKPLAHSVEEGFRMLQALRRTRRIAQIGTQRRSYPLYAEAKRVLDSGAVGPVRLVNAWWMNYWDSLSAAKLEGTLHWELFLGSAPKRPLDPLRFFNWLHFYDYSGGILVGQAAHIVDGVQWMMNSGYPVAVTCAAGPPNIPGAEIPETASVTIEFPEKYILVFTIGYQAMHYRQFSDQMQQFHGARARFDLGRESFALYPQTNELEVKASVEKRDPGGFEHASRAHIANFLRCLRDRSEPVATIEMGQRTNVISCMAVASLRSGRRIRWNKELQTIET